MIEKFDSSLNFWDLHPQFKIKTPFRDLYEKDKSKKKEESSLIMWFIAFCYDLDPRNIFRNAPLEDKHEVVGLDYCGDKNYFKNNRSKLEPLITAYLDLSLTPEERHYANWVALLEDRSKFLQGQKYGLENFEALDKMAAATEKLILTLKKIKESIAIEKGNNGAGKGDRELSLTDVGDI